MSYPEIPETVVMDPDDPIRPKPPGRSPTREAVGQILIAASVALALGATLKQKAMISANDISRWCTVWALLERGTYAIDECPWQLGTQDKVLLTEPFPTEGEEPSKKFYSSKPPLLPTLIAGALYPARALTGVPLDAKVEQQRSRRKEVQSLSDTPPEDPSKILSEDPERGYRVVDVTPDEPAEWPVQVLYFNPVVVLLNVVPLLVALVLYARLLDRYAGNDWAWFLSMAAAGLGTNLVIFTTTLNNHTVAAWSAFFALYAFLRIWDDGERHWGYFAVAGFFGAFCACNELPSALFGVLLFLLLAVKVPGKTLSAFVPAALVPVAAHFVTTYLAIGEWAPVYAAFSEEGPDSPYRYPGSYWLSPLGMDWYDLNPEPWWQYLLNLLVGHHGIFSLTPVFLFSFAAMVRSVLGLDRRLRTLSGLTLVLSAAIVAFYTWQTHNYGGSTQGARWLFWLFPFWLILLPMGLEGGQDRPWLRRLTLAALAFAVFNTGYGLQQPWSHPWIVDAIEHLGVLDVKR
ncbi:hypothetical protein [Tautonia plasticadhaerens]|uniref:Glycosyltransferase RgtA/B/C/D-like domain-containing protein n=1 Tax=Tautonia plasticadhaerens TaxID=2527974 RepID=A0A518HCR8_9BACT|nr:hypothetical protein [Tautonia plasticadhaerens]QDV38630.1 hypothetical protein ElP_65850 [Tautonia plasticadhaerens]